MPTTIRGCTRSVRLPTGRASTIDIAAIGRNSSAAWRGEKPRTACAQSISGKPIDEATKPITVIATLDTEKLRSVKRLSGTSGSCLFRDCQNTKATRKATPPTIIAMIQSAQCFWWPSWMPNASRNSPMPDSATPSQSKWCECVGRFGTSRTAITNARMPTGTLTKKIHSQPRPSVSTPPRIGPTTMAMPAVAPQTAIALPRSAAGKIRVMIAIVCGVIIDAPKPCTTRARMSISIVLVRPHHSEAAVKTVRPAR